MRWKDSILCLYLWSTGQARYRLIPVCVKCAALHVGFRPDVFEELIQAVNETRLSPSQLLEWSWHIAKSEIMQSTADSAIMYTNRRNNELGRVHLPQR